MDFTAKRVWIIDDEALIGKALALRFKKLGAEVETFLTVEEVEAALQRISSAPDAVLCDLNFPNGRTGIEIWNSALAKFPVLSSRWVFMTGGATDDAQATFLMSVETQVLYKPFPWEELLKAFQSG